MKISKQGITFEYNNDEITWSWWWTRTSNWPFFSLIYNYHFKSFKQYWVHVGSVKEKPMGLVKLRGVSMETLIRAWVKFACRDGFYVVLYDINVDAKPASFWRSIPDKDKKQLLEDAVVLRCKDAEEAKQLCDSIEDNFAQALAVSDGYVFYWSWTDLK